MSVLRVLFILSLIVQQSLSQDAGSEQCLAPPAPTDITGFSVFYSRPDDAGAFLQDLRPLVSSSRAEKGNRGYRMYVNEKQPGAIGFVESYADMSALNTHLGSKPVRSIFDHQYYKELKALEPHLFGPWKEVPPETPEGEEIEMVFYWTMECRKKHVWDIITNWTDASWVKGDPKTTIVPLDKDGNVVSDEEAKKIGYVDPEGGLGPVVQRRTWANGAYVDVRMLTKDESTFTTVQQTLSALVFPKVTFDKFYVTLTLDSEGLDPALESRMRYHARATVKTGTNDDARETLKADFYGPRIEFYQQYFNCSKAVIVKRAAKSVTDIHIGLAQPAEKRLSTLEPFFASETIAKEYIESSLGEDADDADASVQVKTAFAPFSTLDLRVTAVEDIVVTSMTKAYVKSRIVIYQLDDWGRVVSMRVFDKNENAAEKGLERKLLKATDFYFDVLKSRDIEQVRKLYAKDAELHDPVSFAPKRTFDSVYTNFYKIARKYEYVITPTRTFVDKEAGQTAQLVDATFELASGAKLNAHPVQIFTFDKRMKIASFEAFFLPKVVDFASLD